MRTFWEWIIEEGHHASLGKRGLYPPLYTQYYNYPPQDVVNWSADAITYMDEEDLIFKFYRSKKFIPHVWKTVGNSGKTGPGGD